MNADIGSPDRNIEIGATRSGSASDMLKTFERGGSPRSANSVQRLSAEADQGSLQETLVFRAFEALPMEMSKNLATSIRSPATPLVRSRSQRLGYRRSPVERGLRQFANGSRTHWDMLHARFGLVQEVVPAGTQTDRAMELAQIIAQCAAGNSGHERGGAEVHRGGRAVRVPADRDHRLNEPAPREGVARPFI